MSKLQEKPSGLKRDNPALQKMKSINWFLFYRSFLPSWIRIRIRIHKTGYNKPNSKDKVGWGFWSWEFISAEGDICHVTLLVAAFIINKEGESATETGGDRVKKETEVQTWFLFWYTNFISPFLLYRSFVDRFCILIKITVMFILVHFNWISWAA